MFFEMNMMQKDGAADPATLAALFHLLMMFSQQIAD
jgi:hypothetical protein